MKNNYPIKYALMPLYEQNGWSHGLNQLERKYEVSAYIVSKCYVLSEIKKYSANGEVNTDYEVVFPYQKNYIEYNEWVRTDPDFNFNSESLNSTIVKNLFDNYSDALKEAALLNKEILKLQIGTLPYNENSDQKIDILQKKSEILLEKYKDLEKQINENTYDLKNEVTKEQSIIVMFNDVDKILNISIYEFIKLYMYDPFYVCNVSKEEYDLMKKQIIENKRLDERDPEKRLKLEYNHFRCLLANDINNNIVKISNYDSENEIGSYYLSSDCYMHYDEITNPILSKNLNGIKVYTTETYSDIIKSYIPRYISKGRNEIKINDIVIKKRLVLK